ncbi:MAG: hypothetical protein NUV32_09335 [Exilispira sp.]|jgi:hypothetical protein|nr:hypothetical protein [Exilispira sp.]
MVHIVTQDGKINTEDVVITLKKQGIDTWSSIKIAEMLFGSLNYLANLK